MLVKKWKNQMTPLLESLEQLDDIRARIKNVESRLLELTKRTDDHQNEPTDNSEAGLVRMIEEVQTIIEEVEMKTNQLDMKLSVIERLAQE
ncbi:MAG: hypothetical protein ACXAEF_06780 [Candidatus Thorarchaeota archaeon]|jgi:hypothetical protein